MNDIIVSRWLTAYDQGGDPVRVAPGRYPFVDEVGDVGLPVTVIYVAGTEAGIQFSDYGLIRQEISS